MSLKDQLRDWLRPPLTANTTLASLYQPDGRVASSGDLPPAELRMGGSLDDEQYLASGQNTAGWIRELARGLRLRAVLDWGCTTGRVLRHFREEAETGEFWGADIDGPAIAWDKEHLSPPFRFVTCTAFPHLPFEDAAFDLVYGLSVFTHLAHLADMWLMELRRVTRPGGLVLLSIHDEATWEFVRTDTPTRRFWKAHGWWPAHPEEVLKEDVTVAQGDAWDSTVTFFRSDWVRRQWGQYFQVAMHPRLESYQTVVELRKP